MSETNSAVTFHMGPSSAMNSAEEINPTPPFMTELDRLLNRPPTKRALSHDDVHLWYSSLDVPALSLQQLAATLDADERERAGRFCFELQRARFVVGRGLLRQILGYYSDVEPSELRFCYSSRGKPSLAGFGDSIQFSLAHSDGYVIFAVTLDRKIGVDLERIVRIVEARKIADRFFADREKAAVKARAGNEKHEAFFKIWTAKEAYLKACGEGLAYPLNKIEVLLGESPSLTIEQDMLESSRWLLEFLRPAPCFTAAFVVEKS